MDSCDRGESSQQSVGDGGRARSLAARRRRLASVAEARGDVVRGEREGAKD